MTVYYVDPSAWIKRHFQEAGSAAVGELFRTTESAVCCRLGLVEMIATVARKGRAELIDDSVTRQLLKNIYADFELFDVLDVTDALIESATQIALKHGLRTMDAIHLAAALSCQAGAADRVIVLTCDQELLAAAGQEGLTTINPLP